MSSVDNDSSVEFDVKVVSQDTQLLYPEQQASENSLKFEIDFCQGLLKCTGKNIEKSVIRKKCYEFSFLKTDKIKANSFPLVPCQ